MAVVVTGLEIFGDVGKCREILWILSCTWDVTDLMFRYDILQRQKRLWITYTEQINLIFIIHFILNAPKPHLLENSFVFTFCQIHVGSTSFSYMSAKIYFHLFSFQWDQLSKEPLAHGTWTQVQEGFLPLWIPFFVFFFINSPLWSFSSQKKWEVDFAKPADGWISETRRGSALSRIIQRE